MQLPMRTIAVRRIANHGLARPGRVLGVDDFDAATKAQGGMVLSNPRHRFRAPRR